MKRKELKIIRDNIRLTDDEWKTLNAHLSAPPAARKMVETLINHYLNLRKLSLETPAPAKTRKTLGKMKTYLEDFKSELPVSTSLLDKDHIITALRRSSLTEDGATPSSLSQHRLVDAMRKQINTYIAWLGRAKSQLPSMKSGRDSGNIDWLIEHLSEHIFERYKKRTITRSYKKPEDIGFIRDVFQLADPQIKNGSIDDAMKKYIKRIKAV